MRNPAAPSAAVIQRGISRLFRASLLISRGRSRFWAPPSFLPAGMTISPENLAMPRGGTSLTMRATDSARCFARSGLSHLVEMKRYSSG